MYRFKLSVTVLWVVQVSTSAGNANDCSEIKKAIPFDSGISGPDFMRFTKLPNLD